MLGVLRSPVPALSLAFVLAIGCGTTDSPAPAGGSTQLDAGSTDTAPDVSNEAADTAVADTSEDVTELETGEPDVQDASGCVPPSCAELLVNCGTVLDGCGGTIDCGVCPVGEHCGGYGPNRCGTAPCEPKSCTQVGAECGLVSDGCGSLMNCGGCAPPDECGAGGTLNICGCSPMTCLELGAECGSLPDGCHGVQICGTCPVGETCGGGGPNLCGTAECTANTCLQLGASCGYLSDGCGEAINCGTCVAPETCGGDLMANQCGCTSKSCSQLGASCGVIDGVCGPIDCGSCSAPDTCGGGGTDNRCGCECEADHATTGCSVGVCHIEQCDTGWGDCDADVTDGCESPLTSIDNCGGCGAACFMPNATALCVSGQCSLGSCDAGFADCDGNPDNGCEANLQADPANCSTCDNECPGQGGTPECIQGQCGLSGCVLGLGNCDGSDANGCEADLNTDLDHCGFCDNGCSFPHAGASCSGGLCQLGACDAGFGDCDGNPASGCETNTNVSLSHCGSCGQACSSPANATATCSSGVCDFTCQAGFADCDGVASNGCEKSLLTDPSHCGTCGNACSVANGTAGCSAGACTVLTCSAGYGDCDGLASTGCEANLGTDPNHCGACPVACSFANAAAACSAGACSLASCNSGFKNCNGVAADGCELAVGADPNNCGACGNVCNVAHGTPACQNGTCEVASCDADWSDCDGSAVNGCESDTTSDVDHCGSCSNACSTVTGIAGCKDSACIAYLMSANSKDCDNACGLAGYATCVGPATVGLDCEVHASSTNCSAPGNWIYNSMSDYCTDSWGTCEPCTLNYNTYNSFCCACQ